MVEANKIAEAFRQHVTSLTSYNVECDLLVGSPHAELIKLADKHRASLVVIGASGEGGVGDALFGTTAENVVRYAHGPVLVVRQSPADSSVIVGTDFSDASTPAVRVGIQEAKSESAELVLFHSTHQPHSRLDVLGLAKESTASETSARRSAAQKSFEALLKSEAPKGKSVIVDEAPGQALPALASQTKASLVVVGTHGRTGLKRMALGSIAATVVRNAPCSVLVVR